MAKLIGPDFLALQVPDPEAAAAFYEKVLGLQRAPQSPPGAVVFATAPIPFALRTPTGALPAPQERGRGVALWMAADDADALHDKAAAAGARILAPPADGRFGRFFVLADPEGYVLTVHTGSRP